MQVPKLFLPEVEEAIERDDIESLKGIFEDLHPSDTAGLCNQLPSAAVAKIIRILRAPLVAEVFSQLEIETQAEALQLLGRKDTITILEELSPDDRVDLLQKLPEETVDSLLPLMAQAERDEVRKLSQYEENTAGALMTTEYASLPTDITVAEALIRLRKIAPDSETIYYVYGVDSERRLMGIASLRDIVLARPTQLLKEIMEEDVISTNVDTDQEVVARSLAKYDLLAIPVVDHETRLLGIITHDDVLDVIVEEQTEDVHRLGAMEPVEEPYFHAGFWLLVRKRGIWLLLLFALQFVTTAILKHFHVALENAIALAFFVPLIISSGGNIGSQSVTLITRALAIGEIRLRDFVRVVWREGAMGLVLGLGLGFIGFLQAYFWNTGMNISLAVAIGLVAVVTLGSLVGAGMPLVFKRLGFDPAIMSSPFVASVVDVMGIAIYFSVAQYLLS